MMSQGNLEAGIHSERIFHSAFHGTHWQIALCLSKLSSRNDERQRQVEELGRFSSAQQGLSSEVMTVYIIKGRSGLGAFL